MEVARGERGPAPDTVTFLSGDVHNSYLAEVDRPAAARAPQSRVVQAVCSPIRNPMPRGVRAVMSLFAKSLVRPMRFVASRSSRVPDPAYPWTVTRRAVVRQQPRARDGAGRRARLIAGSPASSTTIPTTRGSKQVYAARIEPLTGDRSGTARVRSGLTPRGRNTEDVA